MKPLEKQVFKNPPISLKKKKGDKELQLDHSFETVEAFGCGDRLALVRYNSQRHELNTQQ
jgi:hypothetical protein